MKNQQTKPQILTDEQKQEALDAIIYWLRLPIFGKVAIDYPATAEQIMINVEPIIFRETLKMVGELIDKHIAGGEYEVYNPEWKCTVRALSADLESVWRAMKLELEALNQLAGGK